MAGIRPFNPFPPIGEDPYNQPSNRNIAPADNYNKGGIPDRFAGFRKRLTVFKSNEYTLQVSASAQAIAMLAPDINGQVGYTDLGALIGIKSPFVFIPEIYSIILYSQSQVASDLSLDSWVVMLWDQIAQKALFAQSPSNPTASFAVLGFEFQLPILQHDDFEDSQEYLNFLNHLLLLPSGSVFNNTMGTKGLTVTQTLIYRIEQMPL